MREKRFLVENSTHLKHFQALRGKKLGIQVEFVDIAYRTTISDKKKLKIKEKYQNLTVIRDIYLLLLVMLN
jgi:hypothetical protein